MKDTSSPIVNWMLKTLMDLGFTETEAHVYIYLSREGPQKAGDLANALNISKQYLYRSLRKMQSEEIVQTSSKYKSCLSTVPFEKVLDLLMKAKISVAKSLMQNKKELLSTWRSLTEKDDENS